MTKEVRQFNCPDCNMSWWRVVPFNKAVSKCKNCHKRFDAVCQRWEFGVGRFTCTDCGNIFYAECYGFSYNLCPVCLMPVNSPYIRERNKCEPHIKKCFDGNPFYSMYHNSTGSTEDTWLSQTAALIGFVPDTSQFQRSQSLGNLRLQPGHNSPPIPTSFFSVYGSPVPYQSDTNSSIYYSTSSKIISKPAQSQNSRTNSYFVAPASSYHGSVKSYGSGRSSWGSAYLAR